VSRRARPDEPPPEFFVDRSLGSRIVPEALRRVGLTAHAMADVYPNLGEDLADETWIPEVTARGWIILLKDDRVRSNPAERAAILDSAARVFCVTRGNLTGVTQAEWLVNNRYRILQTARKRGPYVYGVYENRLERLLP